MSATIRIRIAWLSAAVTCFGCATTAFRDWKDIPTNWHGTYVFVEAEVNESPQRLLLDTGSDVSVVSPGLVSRLGVSTYERDVALDTLGSARGSTRRDCATVDLSVGPLLQRVDAVQLSLDGLSRALGEPVPGIVGIHMWADATLQIDYLQRAVRISSEKLPVPDGKTILSTKGGRARIALSLPNGRTATVIVDSGSAACLVLPQALEHELRLKVPPRLTGYSATAGGVIERRTGRLDGTIRIGGHAVDDPLVRFAEGDVGRIGTRILRHFKVTLDCGNSRIAFERDALGPIEIPPIRGIGAGFSKGQSDWTVLYTLPGGGAARSGLRTGDRVTTINGAAANSWAARLDDLMETATTITLGVVRGGVLSQLEVPVETIVE